MVQLINLNSLVAAIIFSVLGLGIFGLGFYVFDKLTPYNLWKEIIEKQNLPLAIVVGAGSIGICVIIASAIH